MFSSQNQKQNRRRICLQGPGCEGHAVWDQDCRNKFQRLPWVWWLLPLPKSFPQICKYLENRSTPCFRVTPALDNTFTSMFKCIYDAGNALWLSETPSTELPIQYATDGSTSFGGFLRLSGAHTSFPSVSLAQFLPLISRSLSSHLHFTVLEDPRLHMPKFSHLPPPCLAFSWWVTPSRHSPAPARNLGVIPAISFSIGPHIPSATKPVTYASICFSLSWLTLL